MSDAVLLFAYTCKINPNKFKTGGKEKVLVFLGQMVKDPGCHLELIRSTVLVFWL